MLGVSGVENRSNAIDGDLDNSSQLRLVALGGLEAWQSIRFPSGNLPAPNSPIYVKLTPPPAVLSLLSGISIVRTVGDDATTVGEAYSDGQLLDLLGLLSENQPVEFTIPVPEDSQDLVEFDGVRFWIGGVLSAGSIGRYYFAFFISKPLLLSPSKEICEKEQASIQLSHFEPGYKYRVYSNETGGSPIAETTSSLQISLPTFATEGVFTYWVEAVDSDTYVSARVPFKVTVLPQPGKPHLTITDIHN
ncbi:MAG TPA: hypothetical protein VNQ80_20315 [Parapedobacter sp.]|nr:hypothetical protein [Parapedobacter sp.]